MDAMHRLFGKSAPKVPSAPEPTLSDASASINVRIAALNEKISGLDDELRKYSIQLKKATGSVAQSIRQRAIGTLKRKRMYEAQREQLTGQAFNVEQTAFAIDSIKDTHVMVAAMKSASKQLKIEQQKINLSELEDMQDDLADMLEDQEEISDMLSRSYGTPDGIAEEDLEAELAGLEDELEGAILEEPPSSEPSTSRQAKNIASSAGALPIASTSQLPMSCDAHGINASAVDEFGLPI